MPVLFSSKFNCFKISYLWGSPKWVFCARPPLNYELFLTQLCVKCRFKKFIISMIRSFSTRVVCVGFTKVGFLCSSSFKLRAVCTMSFSKVFYVNDPFFFNTCCMIHSYIYSILTVKSSLLCKYSIITHL